ncbi:MAG: arginine--tRNA ligase [Clostridiales Family XIII bacterium]|jgi:arginyl-tRNA synthetase|nr:arginine--tRNA ligase [Clostridiales Family XIII bacterium]
MIDFKEQIAGLISANTENLTKEEARDMLEIPASGEMGDYAFPCFRLAKAARKAPPLIAAEIAESVRSAALFERVNPVGAYVNVFLAKEVFLKSVLSEIAEKRDDYGRGDIGRGKKVIVEFSSPNIAKPFHIGHIRSTVIGNAINNIYAFLGYDTVKINHIGDYGTQFGKMIVAYRKWGNREDVERDPIKTLLSYYTRFHAEAENDASLEDEARLAFVKLEKGEAGETALWRWFRDMSMKEFERVYGLLGIEFDSYAGESFYSDKMERVVNMLNEKGLLEESEGAQIVNLEKYGMAPALITKKDGSTLYITRDIAAAVYRKERYDFYKNIYVVASQQNLHFQQWFKIIELLGFDWAKDCVHIPFGLVSLDEGAVSTRAGRVVFLEDVLNRAIERTREIIVEKNVNTDNIDATARQVGIGAVIFQELSSNRIKDYTFSWEKVLNFDGETGPYAQYSHARASSVLRKGGASAEKALNAPEKIDVSSLKGESACELARLIYRFPEIIFDAAEKYEPSVVTRHIVDVAQAFNKFYRDERVLTEDAAEKEAKLALVFAAKQVIKTGLRLLGVEAPERM